MRRKLRHLLNNSVSFRSLLTMLIHGTGRLLGLFSFVLLARLVSVQEYGHITFGNSMARLASAIAMMGCLGIMVKTWGWTNLDGYERKRYIYYICNWYMYSGLSIVIFLVLAWVAYLELKSPDDSLSLELLAFLYVIPLFVANLYQSFFISIKKPLTSGAILIFFNSFWVIFLLWVYFFGNLSSQKILLGLFGGVLVIAIVLIFINSKQYGIQSTKPQGGTLNFALAQWGSMLLAQSPIILLKYFSGPEQIAYYGVAMQLSMIIAFVLGAINSNVVSQLAEDYKRESKQVFQNNVTRYTRILAVFSIITLLILFIFGRQICLLFGDKYEASYFILCILMVGQLVNAFSGCNGWLLNLTGHESVTVKAFYMAIIVNIVLGMILVKSYGAVGVAASSAAALVFWNLLLTYFCLRRLDINSTIFPFRAIGKRL